MSRRADKRWSATVKPSDRKPFQPAGFLVAAPSREKARAMVAFLWDVDVGRVRCEVVA